MTDMATMLDMMRDHGIPTDRVFAWSMFYFPFTMGGDVWQAAGAEVECDEPIWFNGHALAVCRGPDGASCVVEFTTGAVVGQDLLRVKADIAEGDPEVMKKQIDEANKLRKSARKVEVDHFWKCLTKAQKQGEDA